MGDGGSDLRRKAAGGSPWRLLYGGGQSVGGDRCGGDDRRSLAAECWGGKVSSARAVLGVEQVWPEEDRCWLTSWRLSAAAARL
jgi:hypothetical protein